MKESPIGQKSICRRGSSMDEETRQFYIQSISDELETASDENLVHIAKVLGIYITRVFIPEEGE